MIRMTFALVIAFTAAFAGAPSQAAIYRYTSDILVGVRYFSGLDATRPELIPFGYDILGNYAEGSRIVIEIRYNGVLPRGEVFALGDAAESLTLSFTNGTENLLAFYGLRRTIIEPKGLVDVFVDVNGLIVDWRIELDWTGCSFDGGEFRVLSSGSRGHFCDRVEYGLVDPNDRSRTPVFTAERAGLSDFGPGSWAVIPVPASLPLLGAAALALGLFGLRRRKS